MAERMSGHKKEHEEKRKEKHKAPKKHGGKKEMHSDIREDKALIKKMVKPSHLKRG